MRMTMTSPIARMAGACMRLGKEIFWNVEFLHFFGGYIELIVSRIWKITNGISEKLLEIFLRL